MKVVLISVQWSLLNRVYLTHWACVKCTLFDQKGIYIIIEVPRKGVYFLTRIPLKGVNFCICDKSRVPTNHGSDPRDEVLHGIHNMLLSLFCTRTRDTTSDGGGGGVTQGCPYPRLFTPQYPISQIFYPQYPISQIFYPPISHIPYFTVNWLYSRFCKIIMCMYAFIWHTIGENGSNVVGYIYYCCQYMCMGIWNCILTMYTIQICTWGVIKMHSIVQTLNFTNHPGMEYNWNEDLLYVIGVYSTFNKIAYLSYHVQRSHWLGQTPSV